MPKKTEGNATIHYWEGQGRKLIVTPNEVLRTRIANNPILNHLYITDMGYYPSAANHYYTREKGCAEMLIIICTGGKGIYETSKEKFDVLPGQFFILPPGEYHRYEADKNNPWSIYWLRVGGNKIKAFCKNSFVSKCYKASYNNNISEIGHLFEEIIMTLENGYSLQNLSYANMTLQHLLALLIFRVKEARKSEKTMAEKVIEYMKKNINKHFSLKELASAFYYSSSQFSSNFKKETSYSPIDYFINLKLQHACKLLDFTNKKIYDIASEMGYDDPYYFSKLFKKVMHVSPEQYRLAKKG